MGLASLAGVDVVSARISMPLSGVWHADVVLDASAAPAGRVTLAVDGGLSLTGTVRRGGAYLETAYTRIVGGAGGFALDAVPKFYTAATVRVVLGDLLRTAGEVLSGTADPAALAVRLPSWTTIRQSVGSAVAVLLGRSGASWRVLPDGTVWLGAETWPDSGLVEPGTVDVDEQPEQGLVILGVEAPQLRPGMTYGGRQVSLVEHTIRDGQVRTRLLTT